MTYEPPPPYDTGGTAEVPNYLVQSILATLFCCLPFGIVSIVFAAQANSKRDAGDISGAMQAAKNAKKWAWVAFGAGLVAIALYIIVVVMAGDVEDV